MLPRVVVVSRRSEYEEALMVHGTHGQAAFVQRSRGQDIGELQERHELQAAAMQAVLAAIPSKWRRAQLHRGDLDRFLFAPDDIVVAVGQDGLVANAAKYLQGQRVLGVNPDPRRYDGVLVQHSAAQAARLLARGLPERLPLQRRTMVEARLDDGQSLLALNEIFVGHRSHQSARYRIQWQGKQERQSSSGLIVTSGTGSTGWARSIHLQRHSELPLPRPEDPQLAFFVREAWPSVATGASLVEGLLQESEQLEVISEMNMGGVVFGDGIESDRLELSWAQRIRLRRAERRLVLVEG